MISIIGIPMLHRVTQTLDRFYYVKPRLLPGDIHGQGFSPRAKTSGFHPTNHNEPTFGPMTTSVLELIPFLGYMNYDMKDMILNP